MRSSFGTCRRKRRFATQADALRSATSATVRLAPYRCGLCRQYHLTSRTKGMFVGGKSDKAAR